VFHHRVEEEIEEEDVCHIDREGELAALREGLGERALLAR
jgi:hypothetical protein